MLCGVVWYGVGVFVGVGGWCLFDALGSQGKAGT